MSKYSIEMLPMKGHVEKLQTAKFQLILSIAVKNNERNVGYLRSGLDVFQDGFVPSRSQVLKSMEPSRIQRALQNSTNTIS